MPLKTSGELFTGVEVRLTSLCWILLLLFGVLNKEPADNWSSTFTSSGFLQRTFGVFFATVVCPRCLLVFNEPPEGQLCDQMLRIEILVVK